MASSLSSSTERDSVAAYYALFILLLAYILSFIDRNIMSILIGPIRDDFGITDSQFGLLQGLAFTLFYTVLGLPIARLADRKQRKGIIAIGILFWSLMTVACGLVKSFGGFFVARMGVGLGEAALSPPAHSMLTDLFTPKRLPMALAIFTLGITIGGGMAYMLGAAVYGWAETRPFAEVAPFIDSLAPWHLTFIIVGLPGIIVAFAVMALKEPQRAGRMRDAADPAMSLGQTLAYINQRKRVYLALFISISSLSVLGYGYMSWFVEFMMRNFSVSRSEIGYSFGWMFILFGSAGAIIGGILAGFAQKRGVVDINLRLIAWVAAAWLIPGVIGPLLDRQDWAFWSAAPTLLLLNAYFGVAIAALQLITPNEMRAQVSALLLFMTNLLGMGLGPFIVGAFNDYVFASDAALGNSLSLLAAICCPLAIAFALWGLPAYRQSLDEAKSWH